jgi:hypothetical protein
MRIQKPEGTVNKSYGFVVPVALAISLALFLPLLWQLRREAILGWREQCGSGVDDSDRVVRAPWKHFERWNLLVGE